MSGLLKTLENPLREIRWRVLTPEDIEATKELLYEHFMKHEPLCVTLGIKRENGLEDLANQMLDCLEGGESICAFEPSNNNKICGIRLATGPHSPQNKPVELSTGDVEPPLKLAQMMTFIDHLSGKALPKAAGESTFMKGLLVSVHQDYFQLGLGSALCKKSLDRAKEAGCELFFAECSSLYTAKIFHKLGAKCLSELKYCDYVDPLTQEKILANCPKPHFSAKLICVQFEKNNP